MREEVDEDLVAYLFASISFNLFDYFDECRIRDFELQKRMKEYLYFTFFQNAIEAGRLTTFSVFKRILPV